MGGIADDSTTRLTAVRGGICRSAVGTPDPQVLNGTARPVHGADVAVIVTNGGMTGPAVTFAEQQRPHVVDRKTLAAWASGSRPLRELLPAVPPPRRPTSPSVVVRGRLPLWPMCGNLC